MDSNKNDEYMVTDMEGMLQILRGIYSFEKSQSILQIATEEDTYEDDYIEVFMSSFNNNAFYYRMKKIPEWY